MNHYILNERHEPVAVPFMKWAQWFENANRTVKKDQIDTALVSTVFIGLDQSLGSRRPEWFETMIFGDKQFEGQQWRYSTWDEALKGHKAAVKIVKKKKQL